MTRDEWEQWREMLEARLDAGNLRGAASWIEEHDFEYDGGGVTQGLNDEQYEQAWSIGHSTLDAPLEEVWKTLQLVMPKHEDMWNDFELEATMTREEVEEVEAQYDVQLPEDHRTFLQYIGRGAPGITSLDWHDEHGRWEWDDTLLEGASSIEDPTDWLQQHLGDPFPWEDGRSRSVPRDDPLPSGVLPIEDRGCLRWDLLIVTGESAGKVYPMSEGTHDPAGADPFWEWYRWCVGSCWEY